MATKQLLGYFRKLNSVVQNDWFCTQPKALLAQTIRFIPLISNERKRLAQAKSEYRYSRFKESHVFAQNKLFQRTIDKIMFIFGLEMLLNAVISYKKK